jgi:hypothetical protein
MLESVYIHYVKKQKYKILKYPTKLNIIFSINLIAQNQNQIYNLKQQIIK